MKTSRSGAHGYTLIEMIIAIVLIGLLGAVGVSMFADSFDTTRHVNTAESSAAQARNALERITREVREMKYASPQFEIADMREDQLKFTSFDGQSVSIKLDGGVLKLARTPAGGTEAFTTLAERVKSLAIKYYPNPPTSALAGGQTPSASDKEAVRFIDIALEIADVSGASAPATVVQQTRIAMRNL